MALLHFSSLCLLSFHRYLDCSSARLPSISRREVAIERASRRSGRCRAAVAAEDVGREEVLVPAEAEAEEAVAEYDWREEWYPLYLTEQVPDDAPLGLSVFDKQLVLYRDGDGVLRCFEDRCPHRCAWILLI